MLSALVLTAVLTSCSKSEDENGDIAPYKTVFEIKEGPDHPIQGEHLLSREQAILNANVFVQEFQRFVVPDVSAEVANVVPFTKENLHLTRAADVKADTLFYAINYKNNQGFVLASADDRMIPVLAYIDKGNYSPDDTDNIGFNMFVNNIINKYYRNGDQSLLRGNERNLGNCPESFLKYQMLFTNWGPRTPYNRYFTSKMRTEKCIALGQICAFLGQPSAFTYGDKNVFPNWKSIRHLLIFNGGELEPDSPEADQMAMLLASFCNRTQEETTMRVSDPYLTNLVVWRNKVDELGSKIDDQVFAHTLQKRRLIYATGFALRYDENGVLYTDRHAWVMDGFFYVDGGSVRGTYMHCNWGMSGDKNGYYLCNAFDSDELPEMDYGDHLNRVSYGGGYYSYFSSFATIYRMD